MVEITGIIGQVVDRKSATPLPDIKVALDDKFTFTDDYGRFSFVVPQPGWFKLTVRTMFYRPYSKKIELHTGQNELIIALDRTVPDRVYTR